MNKFLSLLIVLFISSLAAQAQTQKGNQLLGGLLSFSTGKGTTTQYDPSGNGAATVSSNKISSFGIGPSYSYFVADNLDLGVNAGYSTAKQTSDFKSLGNDIDKQTGYNYAVYLRKYFLFDNKVGFRVGPYVSYQHMKSARDYQLTESDNEESLEKIFNAGIGLDFVYFPTRRIGLAASLGNLSYERVHYIQSSDNQINEEQKNHAVGFNLASGVALSVYYSFGK
jgi:long-subunit fatty acid transport protein